MNAGDIDNEALQDRAANTAVEELQEELAKWQERVPKLAAALRERTEQTDRLQAQVDAARERDSASSDASGEAGIRAREQLIGELEAKLKAVNSKHQDLQGQLHSRDMEISDLQQDVGAWKEKWQAATVSLDEQGSAASSQEGALERMKKDLVEVNGALEEKARIVEDRDHELGTLRDESVSLNGRNAKLFETTELANRQLETLGESLTELRDQLRSRDDDVAALQERLEDSTRERDDLQTHQAAHDELISERETLQQELGSAQQQDQSRTQDLETLHQRIESMQQETNGLKAQITESEEQLVALGALRESEARLQNEMGELQRHDVGRERDLETLHQRIEVLQEEANGLKSNLSESAEQLSGLDAVRDNDARLQTELDQRAEEVDRLTDRMAQLDKQRAEHESREQLLSDKDTQIAELSGLRDTSDGAARDLEARVVEAQGEVERLEECIANADQVTQDREVERRALSEQLSELKERNTHLEAQLNERSNLVMGLEQEKTNRNSATRDLDKEVAGLGEALAKAERHASEHAEHITQLDARLDRQKEHMVELEGELAESKGECAAVQKDRTHVLAEKERQISELKDELEVSSTLVDDAESASTGAHDQLVEKMRQLEKQLEQSAGATEKANQVIEALENKLGQEQAQAQTEAPAKSKPVDSGGELEGLQEEVHKLEQMVRDRTEQLNKVQWQQNMSERTEAANMDTDNKLLMVLNQQLTDARDSNDRLAARVRELETRPVEDSPATSADDLTAIKGIGPKVAGQLVELGIVSYIQIADLEAADLADEAHVLNAFKKRIEKDGWISQARQLLQG